jgi:hypothetical protein
VADFIEFEQQFLAHDFEGADFAGVFLLGEVNLAVPSLADLGEDLEITMAETSAAFSEVGSLPTEIFVQCGIVLFLGSLRWARKGGFEGIFARLTIVDVGEQVEVVVEEVWERLVSHRAAEGR